MVERIEAYVDGRPMPSSSSALTRLASVYRGGGLVLCPSGESSAALIAWSWLRRGRRDSASSATPPASESTDSTYALRKPAKVIVRPDAANVHSSPVDAVPVIRTESVVPFASAIWEAMVRCQISS